MIKSLFSARWTRGLAAGFAAIPWLTADLSAAPAPTPAVEGKEEAPVAFTNSLGMRFVELPNHPVLISIWKTRVRDYAVFAEERGRDRQQPDFSQSPNHPVVLVNWEDTAAFCAWLTKREHTSGKLPAGWSYRLPKDEEWSAAVGLPPVNATSYAAAQPRLFPWGKDWPPPAGAGNYHSSLRVDPYPYTSPVGAFKPNALGLYDLGGNTWEWCEDIYNNSPDQRVLRGGSWRMRAPNDLLAGTRVGNQSSICLDTYGFRCVIQKEAGEQPAGGEQVPAIKP
jgi:formylglycine-generating enzyme required for sulfatase activity